MVVACSALKRAYRDALRIGAHQGAATPATATAVDFVLLAPAETTLRARLAAPRGPGHVLPDPLALLPSQLATLERGDRDEWAAVLDEREEDTSKPCGDQARELAARLRRRWGGGGGGG